MTQDSPKALLRKACLAKRAAIPPDDHARMSQACCTRLCDAVHGHAMRKPLTVAGYAPISGEIDIMGALGLLAARHHVAVLPVVEKDTLAFRAWKPGDALSPGALGTRAPAFGAWMVPDMLFVPLLAFDRRGHRLGYGRGFYDAALKNLRERNPFLLAAGVGFSIQEEASLPAEPHDEPLNLIVTEKEIIDIA